MSSTLFRAGRRIVAATLNAVVDAVQELAPAFATDQATAGTTTSTSYTSTLTGGTACSTTFVAPESGKVSVHIGAEMVDSISAVVRMSFEVREGSSVGSGTVVQAATDGKSVMHTGTSSARISATCTVTGLTPGATYNVQQMFVVSSGTGTYSNKTLAVYPQANSAIGS